MSRVYTEFLLALGEDGEPDDPALFPRVWERLRRDLRWELRRRGLWQSSPSHLGVYGWGRWYGPEAVAELGSGDRLSHTRDALDDLAADAYLYVFVHRLRSLLNQLKVRDDVGGVVRRALRCFVHDSQKQHDPFGYRVYNVLASALEKAVEEGGLHLLEGGRKIGNDTVFGFRPDADPPASDSVDLGGVVGPWNDRLLPGLITARGEERRELESLLAELVLGLPGEGVEVFRFKELIDPLKIDARARWAALWDDRETAFEGAPEEEDFAEVVRIIHPDTEVEERDRFEKLSACVDRGLRRRNARKRTRRHLFELWRFLRAFATGGAPSGGDGGLPSQRRLSKLLRIPRDRFPELFAVLREEIERCLPSISGVGAVSISGGGSSSPNGSERALAKNEDLQAQLLRRTAEALRRNREGESSGPPAPGDLYFLPAAAGEGIEWLLVEEVAGGFLAIAADPFLLLGSGDVEIAAGAPAGPLAVRCDDAVRVGGALLATGERSARLDPGDLARVLERRRELAAGTLDPGDDALEVDDDPEYRDWREELGAARAALAAAAVARFPSPEERATDGAYARPFGTPLALAATALIAVGLGAVGGLVFEQERQGDQLAELEQSRDQLALEVGELEDRLATSTEERQRLVEEQRAAEERYRQELEEALTSDPVVAPPWAILTPGNTRGDGETVEVPAEAKRILLTLYLPPVDAGDRLEIRHSATGEVVWSTELRGESPDPETHLILPRRLLPAGDYRLVHLRGDRELESFGLRVVEEG